MPVVVLTKADLCDDLEQKMIEVSEVAAGVDIVIVSSKIQDMCLSVFSAALIMTSGALVYIALP